MNTTAPLQPRTIRVPDALKLLGFSRRKFYELVGAGELRVIKVGSATLVPVSEIDRWLTRKYAESGFG